ncbi:hypothetical protein BACFIN_07598 [Bacteroides finegoldii DSM 17565]|nr:hypothetical protein BACFIN_07598 [Bacteroides finegoldii DSM 17565]
MNFNPIFFHSMFLWYQLTMCTKTHKVRKVNNSCMKIWDNWD